MSNVVENGVAIGGLGDGELVWHTDMSSFEAPPNQTVLYALEVPPEGGKTGFNNMYAAYETLPRGASRARARARVSSTMRRSTRRVTCASASRTRTPIRARAPGAVHPLVRTHPETGRACLFLGRRSKAYVTGSAARRIRSAARRAVGARDAAAARVVSRLARGRPPHVGQPLRHAPARCRSIRTPAARCTGSSSRAPNRIFKRKCNGSEHEAAQARLDRHRPHGLRDGRAPGESGRATSRCGTARARRPSRSPASGAKVVNALTDLADCDIVFTMVSTGKDVKEVLFGDKGVLSQGKAPKIVVDSHLDLARRVRRDPREAQGERRQVPRRARLGQREGDQGGQAHGRRVGAAGRVRRGVAVSRRDRAGRVLRRRRRALAHRQDLPQRDARRRHPEPVRDHDPRRESRHEAPRVSRLPEQERDGLDVHALQDAGAREPRFPRDVHARAPAQGHRPGPQRRQDARRADAAHVDRARHGADADRPRLHRPGFLHAAPAAGESVGHRAEARERRRSATGFS